jgi:protein-disulfide isomerase
MVMAGVGALLLAGGLIVAGMLLRPESEPIDRDAQAHGRLLGNEYAPVTIEIWEDFQCPVCKAANQAVVQRLEDEYVETGRANLQFRHFAFLGDESVQAAEASECASEQHLFWPYHDVLFAAQAGENRGAFSPAKLKTLAREAGLILDAFDECFDNGRYSGLVKDELSAGKKLGIQGTPAFFIDGQRVPDWRDYEAMKRMIETAATGR